VVESRYAPATIAETVLLVEDNVAIRTAAQKILSECGYVVLEAGSGAEAIAAAREHAGKIDLLLADVDMPGMSGHAMARQLCAERPELRVLYMSGDEPVAQLASEATDPVVLFKKPFTGAALLDKLREVLESGPRNTAKKSSRRKRERS